MSKNEVDPDVLIFADDGQKALARDRAWKVMLVDDEPDIHAVTRMALSEFTFNGRGLEFISVYSGADARKAILKHPDTAIILLDVVMETENAGLDVARFVREVADNHYVRIVLRTGQPGQAPESRVITEYDINDYKEKTELTSKKLFTLMHAALRSYRDIIALANNKRGLEEVIEASANIFELKSMEQFAHGVLEQLTSLLHIEDDAVYCKSDGLAVSQTGEGFRVLAATGNYQPLVGKNVSKDLAPDIHADLKQTDLALKTDIVGDRYIGRIEGANGQQNLLYLRGVTRDLSDLDRTLLKVFQRNVAIAFENVELHQEIEQTQREIVYMLGEAVETRSKETGNHVKRVAEISRLLALQYGLPADEAEILRLASPLHDVGKIGIPDEVLNKPGTLSPDEWEVMKTHAILGYEMLKSSNKRVLQAGALIARDHHEKWDGSGYPAGKKGDDIHIFGRITAVADVFDALGSDRCYKAAWPLEKVIDFMNEQSGRQFEPRIVDLLLENLDNIESVLKAYPDAENAPH
ncbi:response regulator [Hwanghaeella grinnelliae]|uniref:Response regulator n=1 Tax=Hwanghaeella grinnelliae TaxID=2500179 RepID=A0A437QV23_9PROT|nr:DUF3369 domain-containing protein [Hwanghaeella grinnelliae]RVU38372.1 response regulator [Hwanghaeella grinnelliae]